MLQLHIWWNVGKFLCSWTSWWWESVRGNVQGQGGQAVEVHLLNCGNKITISSTADSWVICSSLKDVNNLVKSWSHVKVVFFSFQECVVKNLPSIVFLSQILHSHPWLALEEGRWEIMGILGFSWLNLPSIKRVGSSFLFVCWYWL